MKKLTFILLSTLFLISCNPAAKQNEELQKEAEEFGKNTEQLKKEFDNQSIKEVFPDVKDVVLDSDGNVYTE